MILRLTDTNGNLILVNVNQIRVIHSFSDKKGDHVAIRLLDRHWVEVQEPVSHISILLNSAGLIID